MDSIRNIAVRFAVASSVVVASASCALNSSHEGLTSDSAAPTASSFAPVPPLPHEIDIPGEWEPRNALESGEVSALILGPPWTRRLVIREEDKIHCQISRVTPYRLIEAKTSDFESYDGGGVKPGSEYSVRIATVDSDTPSAYVVSIAYVTPDGPHVLLSGKSGEGAEVVVDRNRVDFSVRGHITGSGAESISTVAAGSIQCRESIDVQ